MPAATIDVFPSVLGKIIVHVRKRQGLSQTEFAQRVGITQSTLSRIEQGTATPDAVVFKDLARESGMSPGEFYELIDQATERARTLAAAAGGQAKDSTDEWWASALAVLGVIGLASLIAVAVAALLENSRRE